MIKLRDNRNNKGFIIEEINDKLIKAGKVEPLETEKVENEPESVEKHIDAVKKKVEKDLEDNRKNSEATVGENRAVFAESVKLKNKAELAELLTKLKEQNIRRRIIPLHEDAEGYRFEVKFERPLKEENESLEEEKSFKDLTIEEMFFEVADKKFKVFDKNGHFTKEAWKLYDKVANRYGDIDEFDALCGEEGCFEDDDDIQYTANESLNLDLPKELVPYQDFPTIFKRNIDDTSEILRNNGWHLEKQDITAGEEWLSKDGIIIKLSTWGGHQGLTLISKKTKVGESLKEAKEPIDLEALRFYVENWSEGDNVTVTADLLNVLEQALEMAEKHGLKESEVKHEEEKKVCPKCGKEVCECDKKLKEFKPLKKEDEKIPAEWDFDEEDRLALESFAEEVSEEVVADDDTNIKLDESLENSSNNMWDFGDED